MAAIALQPPGSAYGPCLEACNHIDCQATRGMAISLCAICGELIGFETYFFIDRADERHWRYKHQACLHEKIERERAHD